MEFEVGRKATALITSIGMAEHFGLVVVDPGLDVERSEITLTDAGMKIVLEAGYTDLEVNSPRVVAVLLDELRKALVSANVADEKILRYLAAGKPKPGPHPVFSLDFDG